MTSKHDPTLDKYHRIRGLRCYPTVCQMLMTGRSGVSVAMYIQNERREYLDIKLSSLTTLLNGHRRELIGGDVPFNRIPHMSSVASREFSDRLSELRELQDLRDMLKAKLDDVYSEEVLSGKTHPDFLKIAKEYRETVRMTHSIKMDLNLTGSRDLGTITVPAEKMQQMRDKYGSIADRAFSAPTSRGRLLAAIEAARKHAELEAKIEADTIDIGSAEEDGEMEPVMVEVERDGDAE